jgi:RNA polymerase sigma factor (sigma-70 family)
MEIENKKEYITINNAIKGNQGAYTILLNAYKKAIFISIYKIIRNKDDAEDLTYEAFGKAFIHLKSYDPSKKFSTWLYRIARNTTIDFIRRNKKDFIYLDALKKNVDGDNYKVLEIKSKADTPEEATIKKQQLLIINKVIKKLKPEHQQFINLRYFKELSYDEISKELKIPLGTVKAKLHRARKALNDEIKTNKELLL